MFEINRITRGSFVELITTPATAKWGITLWDTKGNIFKVYPPLTGIVIETFVDDIFQKYANVIFCDSSAGHIYINSLKLIE